MAVAEETAERIRQKVEHFADLLFGRDMAVVDELWSPGFRLVGSEEGEVAEDRDALADLFGRLFARPVRYRWEFDRFDVEAEGAVAWLFAEGALTATGDDGAIARLPYRLTAVFSREGADWRWRLCSGAEPAAAQG